MSYIVFARKWRPRDFKELIGQEHIVATLTNAIKLNRVAHAYLFAGPRGVGKTSTARILAKALNCQEGPTATPCNKCVSCNEISSGISMDVMEIDGATNRGIEEIRTLRENIKFMPTAGKFKVYIIDEVHQITPEGFNALLKTLEEPPEHAKFIFATTQPHKVLSTIVSRCQRFDFRRISIKEIASKLSLIAVQEGLTIENEALYNIAHAADGSIRDAESIMDQLVSFADVGKDSKKIITGADVTAMLGVIESDILFNTMELVAKKDAPALVRLIDDLVNRGKDLVLYLASLSEHIRDLMLAKLGKDCEQIIDVPKDIAQRMVRQGQDFLSEELLYMFYVISAAHEAMKRSDMPRIPCEMALIKLASFKGPAQLPEILAKLKELEESLRKDAESPSKEYGDSNINKPDLESPRQLDLTGRAGPQARTDEPRAEKAPDAGTGGNGLNYGLDIARVCDIWPQAIREIKEKKISVGSFLSEAKAVSCSGSTVVIGFPKQLVFHKEAVEKDSNKKLIEKVLSDMLKRDTQVSFTLSDELQAQGASKARISSEPEDSSDRQDKDRAQAGSIDDPIVKSAANIFGGRVVKTSNNNIGRQT